MTEYVLQKKLLGRWDYVTYYTEAELETAKRSFDKVSKGDTGYSWRLVKLEVMDEKLLNDPTPLGKAEDVSEDWHSVNNSTSGWANSPQAKVNAASWLKSNGGPVADNKHGLTGSVWVGNPTTKEKKRVPAVEAEQMLANGWIKAGPRTAL